MFQYISKNHFCFKAGRRQQSALRLQRSNTFLKNHCCFKAGRRQQSLLRLCELVVPEVLLPPSLHDKAMLSEKGKEGRVG